MGPFKLFLPLVIFMAIILVLWRGLYWHPNEIPTPLLGRPAPVFSLPNLIKPGVVRETDFLGHITLLNVWATWCSACAEEHGFLMQLSHQQDIVLYGLDYKDNANSAKKWLAEEGNPYHTVAFDPEGQASLDWGVYGTPETFVIDRAGKIRYKIIGPLGPARWEMELLPIIRHLQQEENQ